MTLRNIIVKFQKFGGKQMIINVIKERERKRIDYILGIGNGNVITFLNHNTRNKDK